MSEHVPVAVVADTVIYLQATLSATNVASSFLRRVETGEVRLFVSRPMLAEIRDVLTRPEIRVKNARLTDEELEGFIQNIEQTAVLIDPLPSHFQYERDPKDEHVLNLAIEAKAEILVSHDNDLLDLMTRHDVSSQAFRQQFPDITVMKVGEFLTWLNRQCPQSETTVEEKRA